MHELERFKTKRPFNQSDLNSRIPRYNDDSDYTTNAPSYYDDLARKNTLIKHLALRIWEYQEHLNNSLENIENILNQYIKENDALLDSYIKKWDDRITNLPQEVEHIFLEWLNDGTLEQIINDKVLGNKVDKSQFDSEMEEVNNKIDSEMEEVNNELETKASVDSVTLEKIKNMGVEYGTIKIPDDFRKMPFDFYRDIDGTVKHNYNFNQFKTGKKLYVNKDKGNDSTGDGSINNQFKTVTRAFQESSNITEDTVIICQTYRFNRHEFKTSDFDMIPIVNKRLSIIPENPDKMIMVSQHVEGLEWVQDGVGTWKADRSLIGSVVDLRNRDNYGVVKPLYEEDSLAYCQAESNTWYTNDKSVWVHTKDGKKPDDENFMVNMGHRTFEFKLLNNATLYAENIEVYQGRRNSNNAYFEGETDGSVNGTVVLNNVSAVGLMEFRRDAERNNKNNNNNGLATINIKDVYLFNVKAPYSMADGFNYHYHDFPISRVRECLVIEYQCLSYENGIYATVGNNNATTTHKGVCAIRVGSVGFNTGGPVLADVTSPYTILIDCSYGDSKADWTESDRYVAYEFYGGNSKAILINCNAHGEHNHLYASEGAEVYAQKLDMWRIFGNFNLHPYLS